MKKETAKPDVLVENHGSVMLVLPVSETAKEWIHENVAADSWQWSGSALAVEPRYLGNLLEGMDADGLFIPGYDEFRKGVN